MSRFLWDDWSQYLFFLISLILSAVFFFRILFIEHETEKIPHISILTLWLTFFLISAFVSPYKELSRLNIIHLWNTLSVFWIISSASSEIKIFLQKILCVAVSVFSIFYILSNLGFSSAISEFTEFFLNVNVAGSFIILGLFSGLNLFYVRKESILLSSITVLICSAAFFYTRSVAGLCGIFFGISYLIFKRKNDLNKKLIIGILILAVLIMIFFLSHWLKSSFDDRIRWWRTASQILLNHPWWGSGPGTFGKIAFWYQDAGLKSPYAHSFPLQTACETGLPAAIFLFLFLIKTLINQNGNLLTVGLIAVLFQNNFDFSLNISGIFILFWILLALSKPSQKIKPNFPLKNPVLIYGGFLLLLTVSGWRWGVRPLIAFDYSLNAQNAYDKMDFNLAEQFLKKSIRWDTLPSKYYSGLSMILSYRYEKEKRKEFLNEAILFQKEALKREPDFLPYQLRMNQLIKIKTLKMSEFKNTL